MDTICQSCGTKLDVPYTLIGATITCHECGERTVAQAVAGTRPSNTGYEITFSDFHRLLSDPDYRPAIVPMLRQWFGYEIGPLGNSISIRAGDGSEVDELTLHQSIQSDESKQSALYRAAMTLWR
jgi:hypothetical protein